MPGAARRDCREALLHDDAIDTAPGIITASPLHETGGVAGSGPPLGAAPSEVAVGVATAHRAPPPSEQPEVRAATDIAHRAPTPSEQPEGSRHGAFIVALFLLATLCQTGPWLLPYLYAVNGHGDRASVRDSLGVTELEFGILQSYLGIVPRLTATVAAGYASAAFPEGKGLLTVSSGAVVLLGLAACFAAGSFWELAAGVIIVNVGVGINQPMNAILIGDAFDRSARAMPVAVVVCSEYAGAGVAALSGPLAVALGWRGAVAAYAAATALAFALAAVVIVLGLGGGIPGAGGGLGLADLVSGGGAGAAGGYAGGVLDGGDRGGGDLRSSILSRGSPAVSPSRAAAEAAAISVDHQAPQLQAKLAAADAKAAAEKGARAAAVRATMGPISDGENWCGHGSDEDRDGSIGSGTSCGSSKGDGGSGSDGEGSDDDCGGGHSHWFVIGSSPQLLLVYLAGGLRYGAGMSVNSFNPSYYAVVYPNEVRRASISPSSLFAGFLFFVCCCLRRKLFFVRTSGSARALSPKEPQSLRASSRFCFFLSFLSFFSARVRLTSAGGELRSERGGVGHRNGMRGTASQRLAHRHRPPTGAVGPRADLLRGRGHHGCHVPRGAVHPRGGPPLRDLARRGGRLRWDPDLSADQPPGGARAGRRARAVLRLVRAAGRRGCVPHEPGRHRQRLRHPRGRRRR